jgi:hypothetical protein
LDGIEINVQAEKLKKGAAKNVPTQGWSWSSNN